MTEDQVREQAVDAAMKVFERALRLVAPPRVFVAEALDAAAGVFAAADTAEVDRMLAETGLLGMEPVSDGVRIRLKHAHDLAAGMVAAFDELIRQKGAENYVEWESTVLDPARGQAIADGLPPEQWPPHRRYTYIVVRPGGKTPHQLRQEAERERDQVLARLNTAHDGLTRIDDGYQAVAASDVQAADEIQRLRSELNAVADLAYRAGAEDGSTADALLAIQTRARRAATASV